MSHKKVGSKSAKVRKRLISVLTLIVTVVAMLPLTGATMTHYSYTIQESVDGSVTQLAIAYTNETDPNEILRKEKITLSEDDGFTFTEPNEENEGVITIERAFPVTVIADGESKAVMVNGGTVKEVLEKAKITLGEEDIITKDQDEEVHVGSEIRVRRVTHKTSEKHKAIPYGESYEYSDALIANAKVKIAEGKEGVETYTYDEMYIDGKLYQSTLIGTEVTTEPVNAVYQIGSSKKVVSDYDFPEGLEFDEKGNPLNYKYKVSGKATAYSTRKKTKLIEGCVAMDLSKYPRGSWLYIKSKDGSYVYGYAKVADTGTALVNGTVLVDLFFDTFAECYEFGARQLDVYVLS